MSDAEPQISIYGQKWVQAVNRLDALPDAVRGAFARMLAKMEEGWKFAGPMQAAVEAGPNRDGYTHTEVVYYAAEVLIVDLFRTLALELAGAVPDMDEGCAPDAMLDDVESESELFMRYLIMTEATLAHPDVDPDARAELLGPIIGLREWMEGYWQCLKEMEAVLVSLNLPERPRYERRVQRFHR
jgi:hypothetical protein